MLIIDRMARATFSHGKLMLLIERMLRATCAHDKLVMFIESMTPAIFVLRYKIDNVLKALFLAKSIAAF